MPNAANQLITGRKLGYEYDASGNQTKRNVAGEAGKSWKQTWDNRNRLVKVEKTKGTEKRTVTFTYDPLGRRIGKQVIIVKDGAVAMDQSWSYLYDADNIAVEYFTENNATTKTFFTHGPGVDEHLALERGGEFFYYHADGLGSVATITDAANNVVQSYDYDSYGMVTPSKNFRNSYTYTGREWGPEAGLHYYRARYYDPMEGSFVSKDPIGFKGGINLYAYVQGNVVNAVDPMGLEKLNLLDWSKDPDLYNASESEPDTGGAFSLTIYGHSTKQELAGGRPLTFGGRTVDQLVKMMIDSGKWVPGMSIKLQGCRSGEGSNSFAEQLSKKLNGAIVRGADNPVWLNPITGKDFYSPYPPISILNRTILNVPNLLLPGKWNTFK